MSEIEEWKKAKREALALHVKKEQEKLKEVTDKYLMGTFSTPDFMVGKSYDLVIVDEPFKLDVEPEKSVGFWEDE